MQNALSVNSDSMDFVMPLKSVGLFTRTVLEGISLCYNPRHIYIICMEDTRAMMLGLMGEWSVPHERIHFVNEDAYFLQTTGFTRDQMRPFWVKASENGRDYGWWWQQLLKLGAGVCIEDISENFCVWDADLIVLEPWPLAKGTGHSPTEYYVAPLQEQFCSASHEDAYNSSTQWLLGLEPTNPSSGGTWVAHHMVFNKSVLLEMFDLIECRVPGPESWPAKILSASASFNRISEYNIYGTYVTSRPSNGPPVLQTHSFDAYGRRGLRLYGAEEAKKKGRDSNENLMRQLNEHGVPRTGYSYERVAAQVAGLNLSHLQMEHVITMAAE